MEVLLQLLIVLILLLLHVWFSPSCFEKREGMTPLKQRIQSAFEYFAELIVWLLKQQSESHHRIHAHRYNPNRFFLSMQTLTGHLRYVHKLQDKGLTDGILMSE